jgi:hypothetical protein
MDHSHMDHGHGGMDHGDMGGGHGGDSPMCSMNVRPPLPSPED